MPGEDACSESKQSVSLAINLHLEFNPRHMAAVHAAMSSRKWVSLVHYLSSKLK